MPTIILKKFNEILFIIFTASTLFIANVSAASDIFVCHDSNYKHIKNAVDSARPGDTIKICPGNYEEGQIIIDKSNLRITSSDEGSRPKITGNILSRASDFSISNLTIISSQRNGITFENSASGTHSINNIEIVSKEHGIEVFNGRNINFKKIKITSENKNGITLHANASGNHLFEDIEINSKENGIEIYNGQAIKFKNIRITSENKNGITLQSSVSGNHSFTGIEINSSENGIEAFNGQAIKFQRVKITSKNKNGIVLESSASGNHSFADIEIRNKENGIEIHNGQAVKFENIKIVSENKNGIFLGSSVSGNHIFKSLEITSKETSIQFNSYVAYSVFTDLCLTSDNASGIIFPAGSAQLEINQSSFKANKYSLKFEGYSQANNIQKNCFYACPQSSNSQNFENNYWNQNCKSNNIQYSATANSCSINKNSCFTPFTPPTQTSPIANFNAFDSPGATSIQGPIKTKVAGRIFSLEVVAVNQNSNDVANTFTGNVKVELISVEEVTAGEKNCINGTPILNVTPVKVEFSQPHNGRAQVSFISPDAWRNVRARITYPLIPTTDISTIVACSDDNFAIRPANFQISAHHMNWEESGAALSLSPESGNVHKAGQPFQLKVIPGNSAGQPVSGYVLPAVLAQSLQCSLQIDSSCTNGSLKFRNLELENKAVIATSYYSEAGIFKLTLEDKEFAAVDAKEGDTPLEERTIKGEAMIGRFVPDHFALSSVRQPKFGSFCSADNKQSFTYIGQPFGYDLRPQLKVTAQNAQGGTTENHRGNAWDGLSIEQVYASSSTPQLIKPSTFLFSEERSIGTAQVELGKNAQFFFLRTAESPQESFAAQISLRVKASQVFTRTGQVNSTIFNSEDFSFGQLGQGPGITFNPGHTFRYGQLRLDNAHGSDRVNLPIPVTAHYWDGSRFVLNQDDHCTTLSPTSMTLTSYRPDTTEAKNLLPNSHISVQEVRLQGGYGQIVLQKPKASLRAPLSATLCINLDEPGSTNQDNCVNERGSDQIWLKRPSLQGPLFELRDPASRATFGVFKSGPVIYKRENY